MGTADTASVCRTSLHRECKPEPSDSPPAYLETAVTSHGRGAARALHLTATGAYARHLLFDNVVDPAAAGPRERFETFARAVRDVRRRCPLRVGKESRIRRRRRIGSRSGGARPARFSARGLEGARCEVARKMPDDIARVVLSTNDERRLTAP